MSDGKVLLVPLLPKLSEPSPRSRDWLTSARSKEWASSARSSTLHSARGVQVWLHIYDLGTYASGFNNLQLGSGGLYHVGVEVHMLEWSFGQTTDGSTGVTYNAPKRHEDHTYRESMDMGQANLSRSEVCALIEDLKKEWPGSAYHLLRRNCLDFAKEFCNRLGVEPVPDYLFVAPKQGLHVAEGIKAVAQEWNDGRNAVASDAASVVAVAQNWFNTIASVGFVVAAGEEVEEPPVSARRRVPAIKRMPTAQAGESMGSARRRPQTARPGATTPLDFDAPSQVPKTAREEAPAAESPWFWERWFSWS
mmetsp:Transcript_2759/g.6529  ORF Transcript_2759/g.6529 Transcript_2759/m.6529 type:complete len:307 (+) Transcript_2759:60-980(+)